MSDDMMQYHNVWHGVLFFMPAGHKFRSAVLTGSVTKQN